MTALGLVLLALLAPQAQALSVEEVQHWLKCYSVTPQPELTMAALKVMDREVQAREGWSLAHEAHQEWRTFYAKIFAANPNVAAQAGAALGAMPEGRKVFVGAALRLCGTPACVKALPAFGVPEPVDDRWFSVMDAAVLDSWAAFAATGDARYVREVIDEVRADTDPLRSGGTAELSLISSAHQDSRVMSILETEEATTREPAKTVLKQIIELAKAERRKRPPPELDCRRRPTTR